MLLILAASAAVAGLVCLYWIMIGDRGSERERGTRLDAYILENQVTHARLLPTPSAHAFSYPTLALLLSLDALEAHALDLGHGWLFGYGGTSWRVAGLRSAAYLLPDPRRSIKEKLGEVLGQYGHDARRLGEVWLLTMPSYMGYEGINPLTVHYCYEKADGDGGALAWVVLEVCVSPLAVLSIHMGLQDARFLNRTDLQAPGTMHPSRALMLIAARAQRAH